MRYVTLGAALLAMAVMAAPVAAGADTRSDAKRQVQFGIQVAGHGLWREAAYRWRRAVEIDPTYAAAWNNLAVAHEQSGEFEEARQAYERALELEPNNATIQQNFDLFREINERTSR